MPTRFGAWWSGQGKPRAIAWLVGNSVRVVLFVAGSLLVLAAVFAVPEYQAVASTLTAAGTALIGFGALLPYIEGGFAFGPFRGGMKPVPPTVGVKVSTPGDEPPEPTLRPVEPATAPPTPPPPPPTNEEDHSA
jgi:hypothetical protein